jgi:beta-glucosidase
LFFNYLPGTNQNPDSHYAAMALYPFGYGLSYTSFKTAIPTVTSSGSPNGSATVKVKVTNTGDRTGTDIVPIYVSKPVSQPLWWHKRLVGFTRVHLNAGQSRTVTVSFPLSILKRTQGTITGQGPRLVEPWTYKVTAGENTRETATFAVHRRENR